MPLIVVANPKGGVGKSTVSTHVAAYLASQGKRVVLADADVQQSVLGWLAIRPTGAAPIKGWNARAEEGLSLPAKADCVVLDTPAGLHGRVLKDVVKTATKVLVPVQPSIFDMTATRAFLEDLQERKKAQGLDIALVGMRVDQRTVASENLKDFLAGLGFPVLSCLRSTQNYVRLTMAGLTLFDVPAHRVERDLADWQPICDWLNR
ncbi:MAG TPA: ParA family protein [Burkholderiaceae bacterium]|nr:ParA family protein [Burkholderiaceae bacterium]